MNLKFNPDILDLIIELEIMRLEFEAEFEAENKCIEELK